MSACKACREYPATRPGELCAGCWTELLEIAAEARDRIDEHDIERMCERRDEA